MCCSYTHTERGSVWCTHFQSDCVKIWIIIHDNDVGDENECKATAPTMTQTREKEHCVWIHVWQKQHSNIHKQAQTFKTVLIFRIFYTLVLSELLYTWKLKVLFWWWCSICSCDQNTGCLFFCSVIWFMTLVWVWVCVHVLF